MRCLPMLYWRYLTPDLLPMKDHPEEIARLRAGIRARNTTVS